MGMFFLVLTLNPKPTPAARSQGNEKPEKNVETVMLLGAGFRV